MLMWCPKCETSMYNATPMPPPPKPDETQAELTRLQRQFKSLNTAYHKIAAKNRELYYENSRFRQSADDQRWYWELND